MRYAIALALAASIGAQTVPRPAKDFICSDATGKKIALSSYKGKVILVQFLSTSCMHCQALSQMLTKLQAEYGPQGFQAVGIAFNEANASMVRGYIEDHHIGIPVGFAPRDKVLEYLGVSVMDQRLSVPQVVVIDRAGQVRAQSEPQGTRELSDESYLRGLIVKLLAGAKK